MERCQHVSAVCRFTSSLCLSALDELCAVVIVLSKCDLLPVSYVSSVLLSNRIHVYIDGLFCLKHFFTYLVR